MNNFNSFTNLQSVTKTIKFRLDPIGKTMKNIQKNNVLVNAQYHADRKKDLKSYTDAFHKSYIDDRLTRTDILGERVFSEETLKTLYNAYKEEDKKEKEEIFKKFGNDLSDYMQDSEEYKVMEKKEFITEILPKTFAGNKEAQDIFDFFKRNTTDVKDLNKMRKELYSKENKFGTIINRTIWTNLETFMENAVKFELFQDLYKDKKIIYKKLDEYIQKLEDKTGIRLFGETSFDILSYKCFCSQLGIDAYNTFIGGYSEEDGTKIPGLNEIINIHNSKTTDNDQRMSLFKPLYKQMMSDKKTFSFVENAITSDKELYDLLDNSLKDVYDIIPDIGICIHNINDNDLSRIYVSKNCHGDISNALYGKYHIIEDAINNDYNINNPAKDKETASYIAKRKKYLNDISCYSIKELNDMLNGNITPYFISNIDDCIDEYNICVANYSKMNRSGKPFKQNRGAKTTVKSVLDSLIAINRLLKNFVPAEIPNNKDDIFYDQIYGFIESLNSVTRVFNKARNYATKKEFEKKELSLSFNNTEFLSGWSDSYKNNGVILLKDNNYYLAINDPASRKSLKPEFVKAGKDNYKMVDYHLLTDPMKSLPKIFMGDRFRGENEEIAKRTENLYDIYLRHKNDKYDYSVEEINQLITYYQKCLKLEYGDIFDYTFKAPEEYEDLRDFSADVAAQSYKLNLIDVSTKYIDSLVDDGHVYLFKISSRDFSDNPKNTITLFGLYWKMLFDERNLNNPIYKLNGGASITYREHSIKNPFVHKAGEAIKLKKSKDGRTRTFNYDIIKNRRYTYDSFFFSVSINANFSAPSGKSAGQFNLLANKYIRENHENMHIIGITRGIKNLIYYTVIDLNGNVVEHNSLNVIKTKRKDGTYAEDNYNENLTQRAQENLGNKKQWDSEYTIKDLKTGYMSQVVSVISNLAIKYNAIIVCEDLRGNFKDKQKAIEKTVYTDFENALVSKMNFLITDKNENSDVPGSALKAYQLCASAQKKDDLKFQNGFVFFISPAYTTNLDPSTGFVNMLYLRYNGKENAKQTLQKFDFIRRDEDCYRVGFDYKKFKYVKTKEKIKEKEEEIEINTKSDWVINTKGIRHYHFRDKSTNYIWKDTEINLTEEFDKLFEEYGIDTTQDIIKQVIAINRSKLYETLLNLLKYTLMCNNNYDDESRYTSSVEGSAFNDKFVTADNVSSYNMARKGLMAIEKILKSDEEFVKTQSTNLEWILYNQNNPHSV